MAFRRAHSARVTRRSRACSRAAAASLAGESAARSPTQVADSWSSPASGMHGFWRPSRAAASPGRVRRTLPAGARNLLVVEAVHPVRDVVQVILHCEMAGIQSVDLGLG